MIGLVKQNIEFTLKKDRFLHCLKTKQPLNDHAANGCLEPKLQNAAASLMPASQKSFAGYLSWTDSHNDDGC